MKTVQKRIIVAVLWACLTGLPGTLPAQTPSEETFQEIVSILKEQNQKLSGDLRHIQREIAALRADLDKPSLKEIFAGIGYIFGLFGVAAFVASRRKEK